MTDFTHFDKGGKARMVNVGAKDLTQRSAIAEGRIAMAQKTLDGIRAGAHGKGDVLAVARLAGIMGAKKTADLIPLCHPLSLSGITVDFATSDAPPAVMCRARVETCDRTGVEMEALTAVQAALLTIYDMCKSADRGMTMGGIALIEKRGGKSGTWRRGDDDTPA